MDELELKKVLKTYETPLYIYNNEIFVNSIKKLNNIVSNKIKIFYSVKANPLLAICKTMVEHGCGLEVSSKGEIYTAVHSGVSTNEIFYSGPGKKESDIRYAIENQIGYISVESLEEIFIANKVAKELNVVQQIFIRINPDKKSNGAHIAMTGIASQFGIDESFITESFFSKILALKNIKLVGLHIYFGTQILDEFSIINNTETVFKLAIEIEKNFNFEFQNINIGGGFGIKYFGNEKELDVYQLKNLFSSLLDKYNSYLSNKNLFMESGRFLTANAGLFITKVIYKKESKGKRFVICDGGSNFHAASAFLGRFVRNNFPLYVLGKRNHETIPCSIVGPLCTSTDIIGQNCELPIDIMPNDFIVVEKSGAYGLTNSAYSFLSFESPYELLYSDNTVKIVRDVGNVEDVFSKQIENR